MSAIKILALGPNPALQRVLSFDTPLSIGGVNRATAADCYVGGKGQGMALALQLWSPGSSAVAHFLGGDNGRFVESSLAHAGLEQVVQQVAAPTRICTTLLTGGDSPTELIDPSGAVTSDEVDELLAKIKAYLLSSKVGGIALCGTTPPGAGALYASTCQNLLADPALDSVLLLLDGHKNVDEVLSTGRVDVLKINCDEARALTGKSTPELAAEALLSGDGAPLSRPNALLALTDGPKPARLFARGGASWTLTVPRIECVNAIGAGDVCTGVLLHSLAQGMPPPDAFAMGLAAACARCQHNLPEFSREEVETMRQEIQIEEDGK